MSRIQTLQDLFKRYRRPGDLVFAVVFLAFSIFLLSQIGAETKWVKRTKLVAQPAFWPAVSLIGMVFFASLHWLSSALSPRIYGRLAEVTFWARSLEYAFWFMAYVTIVPWLGYLPATPLFAVLLALRVGYRAPRMLISAALTGIAVVLVFKTFLQVKVPGGQLYESLPDGLRAFMLTYF
ncbi:MAG: tripartite tricarboxylate transporter TctB family protein [Rhodobacteraceae bacterium]|nr:tripartite tricarboxylate transporter TctB family protein [Paracoccaceae bacterium]